MTWSFPAACRRPKDGQPNRDGVLHLHWLGFQMRLPHTQRSPPQHWAQRHGAALGDSFGVRGFHTHTHTQRSPSQHWAQRHGAALGESFGVRGFHTHAAKSFATLGELHFGVLDTVVAPARAPVAPTDNDTIVDITFRSRYGVAPRRVTLSSCRFALNTQKKSVSPRLRQNEMLRPFSTRDARV